MIERKSSGTVASRDPIISDLEEGLLIDEHALDEALQMQPDLFYQVTRTLASLISRRDAAKQNKEDTEARVDAKIRHDAAVSEEKMTEKQVESEKRLSKDVRAAMDQLASLNEQVGRWSALKEAFMQRSYVLKSMCDLYVAGYFEANISGGSASRMKDHDAGNARREMSRMRSEKR